MTRGFLKLVCALLILYGGSAADAQTKSPPKLRTLTGTATSNYDGDTLHLRNKRVEEEVRPPGIDSPELRQEYGVEARAELSALVKDQPVRVLWRKRDGRGRILGRVLVRGRDVGLEMLRAGAAWFYVEYARELTPRLRALYQRAEDEARAAKRGLWARKNPVPPWEFRRAASGRSAR